MIAVDREAVECDLLQTYGIFDYRQLPARKVAVYACGLGQDSRIMQKLSGAKVPLNSLLLALVADALKILVWQNTKDGAKGVNKPKSILASLTEKERTGEGFDTPEAFEAWRAQMLGEKQNGE